MRACVRACARARVCVFAKLDQFLPVRSHFDTKRPVNFLHIATFPSTTFGPLFAFHCPLYFTKNNNLECRDVFKTVTVTSDQKRLGHTLRTTKHKWSSGFMVLDVSYSRVLGQRPTFYCPLLAVSCPEVWARMYRHIYTVQSMYNVHTKKQNKNNNTTTGRWSHRWSHPTGYLSS